MNDNQPDIMQVRSDGKLGVQFGSPEVLAMYLSFVEASGDPSIQSLIPVIKNDGIIPPNTGTFKKRMEEMGITIESIPVRIWADFLATFQGGLLMDLLQWQKINSDRRRDFVEYLRKLAKLQHPPGQFVTDRKKLRDLIIPTLTEGDGWIPEDMDHVQVLADRWRMTNDQLAKKIIRLFDNMEESFSATEAGDMLDVCSRTMRRWAGKNLLHHDLNRLGYYRFTREVLIDLLK